MKSMKHLDTTAVYNSFSEMSRKKEYIFADLINFIYKIRLIYCTIILKSKKLSCVLLVIGYNKDKGGCDDETDAFFHR